MYVVSSYDFAHAQEPLVKSIFQAADFNAVGHDKDVQAAHVSRLLTGLLDPVAERRLTAETIAARRFPWVRPEMWQILPKCPVAL